MLNNTGYAMIADIMYNSASRERWSCPYTGLTLYVCWDVCDVQSCINVRKSNLRSLILVYFVKTCFFRVTFTGLETFSTKVTVGPYLKNYIKKKNVSKYYKSKQKIRVFSFRGAVSLSVSN